MTQVDKLYSKFIGGRTASRNPIEIADEELVAAVNLQIVSGGLRRRYGYQLRANVVGGGSRVRSGYQFDRQTDGAKWLLINCGNTLIKTSLDMATQVAVGAGLAAERCRYAKNNFAAFVANGTERGVLLNNGGTDTLYAWEFLAPTVAPGLTFGAGSQTLKRGTKYVYCFVYKWTDSLGVQRVHVSAPSPISAHTGPRTSNITTLTGLQVSTHVLATHKWIFRVFDSDAAAGNVYHFAAEITNATTSWGDTTTDDTLDTTRQAPWDNYPVPVGTKLIFEHAGRIIAVVGNRLWISGDTEIDLGVPHFCFPPDNYIDVPSGDRVITGCISKDGFALIGTLEKWHVLEGNSITTFLKRDNVAVPGPVNDQAIDEDDGYLLWVAADGAVWSWNFQTAPDIVNDAANGTMDGPGAGNDVVGYESKDVQKAYMSAVQLVTYQQNDQKIVLVGWPIDSEQLKWFQAFDNRYQGAKMSNGAASGPAVCDWFFNDNISCVFPVMQNGTRFLYFGEYALNAVWRWPEGFSDNGVNTRPYIVTKPYDLGGKASLIEKIWQWVDLLTDTADTKTAFTVTCVVSDVYDPAKAESAAMNAIDLPRQRNVENKGARFFFQGDGNVTGRTARLRVTWPNTAEGNTLRALHFFARLLRTR